VELIDEKKQRSKVLCNCPLKTQKKFLKTFCGAMLKIQIFIISFLFSAEGEHNMAHTKKYGTGKAVSATCSNR
jgi:hypothetical protein